MSRRGKNLIITVIVLAAAILIPVIRHYQLRAETETYIAHLKAGGEPMDLAQVLPPPVPPEQNSADTFRQAAALFAADQSLLQTNYVSGMKMVAPGKAMVCWQQPDVRDYDATNSWQEIAIAVAQNEKSFALLQQIVGKPDFDFQIKYERGFADLSFTNLCLPESQRAALRLEAAILCDLHGSDAASAVENLRAMLAITKTFRDERFVISELVRIAIANIALVANWEILQSPNMTDEQLAELQREWSELDFVQSAENALAMERVSGEITLAEWRNSNSELQHYFDDKFAEENFFDRAKFEIKIFMWRYWWSYSDELRCLKGYEALMNTMRFAQTNDSFQNALLRQNTKLDALGISKLNDDDFAATDFHSMLSQSIASLSGVVRVVMKVEVAKQMVITAIALKRFQLKHGNYPATLSELAPEFLSSIPIDPVDSKPLRYRRKADGTFLLYSVGENGRDDGGDPSLEKGVESSSFYWLNPHALDWVWPQPATPAEVQNFYEHPPK